MLLERAAARRVEDELLRKNFDNPWAVEMVCRHRHPRLLAEALDVALRNPAGHSPERLREAGAAAVPALRKALGANREALKALVDLGATEAAPDVAARLLEKDDEALSLIQALEKIGGPEQAPAVAEAVRRHVERARTDKKAWFPSSDAFKLLGRWGAGPELLSLIPLMEEIVDYDGQLEFALRSARPAGAGEALVPLLSSPKPDLVLKALGLMSDLGVPSKGMPSPDALRAALGAPETWHGRGAARSLGKLGFRDLVPVFLDAPEEAAAEFFKELWTTAEASAALRSADPRERRAALYALKDVEPSLAELEALAADADPRVRLALAKIYGTVLLPAPPGPLARLLSDPSMGVAEAAFTAALARKDLPGGREASLRHPYARVQLRALQYVDVEWMLAHPDVAEALAFAEDPWVVESYEERRFHLFVGDGAPGRLRAFIRTEPKADRLSSLLVDLRKRPPAFRVEPLEGMLDRLHGMPAEKELVRGLHDVALNSAQTARLALDELVKADEARGRAAALRLFTSPHTELRAAAAEFVPGGKDVEAGLLELLRTKDGDAAAKALGRLKRIPRELLRDPDPEIRRKALLAVAVSRPPEFFDDVLAVWSASTEERGGESTALLAAYIDESRGPKLLEALRAPRDRVRAQALGFLAQLASTDASAQAVELLADTGEVAAAAIHYLLARGAAVPAETLLLAAPWPGMEMEVVERLNLREHLPRIVERLANDPERFGQEYLYQALARMGAEGALPGAIRCLRAQPPGMSRERFVPVVVALGGKDAIPELFSELRGPDPQSRHGAALALAELGVGDPEVIRILSINPRSTANLVALAAAGRRDLVEKEFRRLGDAATMAVAAKIGIPCARARALEMLDQDPGPILAQLRIAWGERFFDWRSHGVPTIPSRSLALAAREAGWARGVVGVLDPDVREGSAGPEFSYEVFGLKAGDWSYYVDAPGRVVVTRQAQVIRRWKDVLTK